MSESVTKIKKLQIERFRKFKPNSIVEIGEFVTLISGQNGTMKSTLLGMLAQPFGFDNGDKNYTDNYKDIPLKTFLTVKNEPFASKYNEIFRMSSVYDIKREHKYTITLKQKGQELTIPVQSEGRSQKRKINGREVTINKIRLVTNSLNRAKGYGDYPHPVIYLGLGRLNPLSNYRTLNTLREADFSEEERTFYKRYHREILILFEDIEPEYVTTESKRKNFIGLKCDEYDSETISAGQDNIGQILSAIISFKRLKNSLKDKYRGGLLIIDEIDATLHVPAQEKLLDFLVTMSENLGLQIIATSHSLTIIEKAFKSALKEKIKKINLVKRDGIIIDYPESFESVYEDISLLQNKISKTTVLFEDRTGKSFFSCLLQGVYDNIISTIDEEHAQRCSMNDSTLVTLAQSNIPDFSKMIFILDPDKHETVTRSGNKRLLSLPGDTAIELALYNYFSKLPDSDVFWSTKSGGYSKTTCFRDNMSLPEESLSNQVDYCKKWLEEQGRFIPGIFKKMVERWSIDNKNEINSFELSFYTALITASNANKKTAEKIHNKWLARIENC